MASQTMRVHLSPETIEALALGKQSLSSRVNEVALRYRQLVKGQRPDFTQPQWCAICDALNGCWLQPEAGGLDPLPHLWMEIADCEGLGQKWGVDQAALTARLREASYPELAAVYEVVRTFWHHSEKPTSEALSLALQ